VLQTEVDLEWYPALQQAQDAAVVLSVEIDGRTSETVVQAGTPRASLRLEIPDAELWWPRGHGDQPLYPVCVQVLPSASSASEGEPIDRWDGRVGFRNVSLSTAADAAGTEFQLSVNDQPIYVKGYNWIPDDAFLTRIDADRYRESIMDAYESGANLLRVWGGGIYESQYFYTVCDELGILVWQDFLFACAAYPEEEPLRSEVEEEARQAITRLSSHPSLAIWNGNNENIWGYVDWGWRAQLADRTWGDGYYQELLPDLVAELDPRTPYSPGSPYSFSKYLHPNDARNGTMHIWDVWNQADYSTYRKHQPRFVAEFGFQGPPAWSTLTSVVHDQPLEPYGPQMLVHQKAADGNLKLERGLGDHLPRWQLEPEIAIDDWHWLTQLNQARAIRFAIEHFRSLAPHNTGAVLWQLNDNWPVISWAAVDYRHIRKPLWYAVRDSFADRLLTIQPREDDQGPSTGSGPVLPTLVAHNDAADAWSGELVITRRSTAPGSQVLAEQQLDFHIDARSSVTIALDADVITAGDPTAEFVEARSAGSPAAYWYFVEDPQLRLAADAYQVTVDLDGDNYRVTVAADALVKDLALFPDRLDPAARVDGCLITLRSGDRHTFTVTGAPGLDEVALTTRPVLRSAGDTVTS
jgi:beta-mannosidase